MIHKQLMTYFKVKYGSILIGYYKSYDFPLYHIHYSVYTDECLNTS